MSFDLFQQEDPREWVEEQRRKKFERFRDEEVVGPHCEGCQYDRNPVIYRGDRDAGLMVVGDYTAPADQRTDKPFSGPAGDLLETMLEAIDLDWERDCYVTNALLCDGTGEAPRKPSVDSCRTNLHRQLDLVNPDVVLAMGKFALQSLYDLPQSARMTDHLGRQGSLSERPWIEGVNTYNPAYILRLESSPEKQKQVKKQAWDHLRTARRVLDDVRDKTPEDQQL